MRMRVNASREPNKADAWITTTKQNITQQLVYCMEKNCCFTRRFIKCARSSFDETSIQRVAFPWGLGPGVILGIPIHFPEIFVRILYSDASQDRCRKHPERFTDIRSVPVNAELIEADWRIYALINEATIGSDNSLSPVRRQAIIWISAGLLSSGHWEQTSVQLE